MNDAVERSAGILLHPTCLPSRYGVGDLGPEAAAYVRWLAEAGVRWWQVLPLHPAGPGNSPYSALSTFAGNPWLISPELLIEDGLLEAGDLEDAPDFPPERVDFERLKPWKRELLGVAFDRFRRQRRMDLLGELATFRETHASWLADFALFLALRRAHGGAGWWDWPRPLALRESAALEEWATAHREQVERVEFEQFLFFRQWTSLHRIAERAGVSILGDIPIFVSRDSADVWSRPELFLLDDEREPTVVAGVPPDYFSETGQLWGNPLYDWDHLAKDGFGWWIERLRHTLATVDTVRLDHFRAFAAYWEVPAVEEVATNGRWVPGPGRAFFDAVAEALGGLPFVAEDLGEITPDVVELRRQLGLPGMAILQFAFDPARRSLFIPYAHRRDLVVYTGTHDNNTAVGWYWEDASLRERDLVRRYCGSDGREIHWDLVRLAMASVADLAIVPHQDLVGLGSDCRMNTPAVAEGNWRFRITPWMLGDEVKGRLADLIWTYGRAPHSGSG